VAPRATDPQQEFGGQDERPSRRVVIHGKPARGADGVLLEFSDDLTVIEQREAACRFRAAVFNEAALALSALGVGDPFRCWDAAVELLRQDRESEQRDLERLCERALVLILTQIAWERRGSPGYAPNRDDLAEAALQAASQPLRFQPI
jgi:hypothetical protein